MDGIIRYVNPALAAEVGGDTSGVVGHHYSTVQRRLGLAAMDVSGLPDLREGVWQGRHETLDLAGRRRVFDVTITPIKDDAAQVIGSAAVRREVTRQVDAEARQEQAQRLEAMGTLAAGIAHDFNNILGAILGYVDLAEGATSSSEQVECFGEVRLAARRAVDLVRHILDFSRMTRAEARAVEPRMIIKEAMKLMRAATPATISIETRLESGALVLVDPGEIHRILINLCTNAVVAMQDSGGVLEVRLDEVVRDTPPGGAARFVRLIVKDSGCGISDEHKARIFEPFFTTRAGKGGTGMGLHVVDSIVRARSGSIAVTSTPGEGATFEVLLPVTAHQEPPASDDGEPALPGTEHVLVVDDEPPIADSLGRSLQRLGYRVTVCTRSMEALARILQVACGIDVVVSDVTMPEMTGHQLAERVRRLRPDIPVILCSGFSEGADDLCAREAGDHACLRKPVAARQLSRVIRRVLDGRRACSR
jgi:signal transduction histidine kinase/CheY-like chemotaxis protein